MDDISTYQIELQGQLDESDLSLTSPLEMTLLRLGASSTLFTIRADQSGLIGLLRHLHGRGLVLVSVRCQGQPRNPASLKNRVSNTDKAERAIRTTQDEIASQTTLLMTNKE